MEPAHEKQYKPERDRIEPSNPIDTPIPTAADPLERNLVRSRAHFSQ